MPNKAIMKPLRDSLVEREEIVDFEKLLREQEHSFEGDSENCPLQHSFSEGIYVREMFLPRGTVIVGKILKHSHHIFLMEGELVVQTELGQAVLKAPCHFSAQGGIKRIGYALTDVVWINVHPNVSNTTDLKKIEKRVVVESFEAYKKSLENDNSFMSKLKKSIIKKLIA